MKKNSRIYIAGHTGLVGSAIKSRLEADGYTNIICRSHSELDLTRQEAVSSFFEAEKPDYVFLAAARVGGIHANSIYPAEFIYSNLAIQANVIHAAYESHVDRLLFLGSSCIYPRECPQPMKEEHLLTDPLEPTNQPYAIAKIAGINQCESYNRQYNTRFLAAMPTNLYGKNDNFDLENSHVLPALIRKFHLGKLALEGDLNGIQKDEAVFGPIPEDVRSQLSAMSHEHAQPQVVLWGTGSPCREFLHSNDLADACQFLMNLSDEKFDTLLNPDSGPWKGSLPMPLINIGCGRDFTIRQYADVVAQTVGYAGEVSWDTTRADGTPRKLLDVSKLTGLGWQPKISLEDGIRQTYEWYKEKLKAQS